MQKLAAFILLLAFFGQTFNQGFYFLGYVINKAEYEKRCINKARPMLHCDGKCQLMQKIREQERKEKQQAPEMKIAAKGEVLSSRSSFLLNPPLPVIFIKAEYPFYNSGAAIDRPSACFHPPDMIAC